VAGYGWSPDWRSGRSSYIMNHMAECIAMSGLDFKHLPASIGAEVMGIDLAKSWPESLSRVLRDALLRHQLLLFRNQDLDAQQQVRFASVFGPVRQAGHNPDFPCEHPQAHYLSNVDNSGRPTGIHPEINSTYWHSDGSWSVHPARATVLYGIEVPETGGETLFADMYGVYESLAPALKRRYASLHAIHDLDLSRASRERRWPWQKRVGMGLIGSLRENLSWTYRILSDRRRRGYVHHPVVRRHPQTGRPALFAGDHAWCVSRWFLPLGIYQMRRIKKVPFPPEFLYAHQWRRGDVLVWDNRCLLHRAGDYDFANDVRILRRCVVLDEPG